MDNQQRESISEQIIRLAAAADVGESSSRMAGVTKEAAILNARVAESSSSAMIKAATVVADALDRNTTASNKTGRRMIWLTAAYVVLTLGLLISAWCQRSAT